MVLLHTFFWRYFTHFGNSSSGNPWDWRIQVPYTVHSGIFFQRGKNRFKINMTKGPEADGYFSEMDMINIITSFLNCFRLCFFPRCLTHRYLPWIFTFLSLPSQQDLNGAFNRVEEVVFVSVDWFKCEDRANIMSVLSDVL